MSTDKADYTFPCNECQAGQMRRVFVTYFTWLGEELITVPDFPAWRCDVCGRREYDMHALNQLSLLLNPNAGSPTHAKHHTRPQKIHEKTIRPPKPRD
jgi:YgiT-type zinc finger domain-containing protein